MKKKSYHLTDIVLNNFNNRVLEIKIYKALQVILMLIIPFAIYSVLKNDYSKNMSKIIGISFFVELFITLFFLENYFSLKYNLKRIITKIDVSENKIQFTLLSNDVLILDENFKFKLFNKEGGFIERSLSFYSKNTLLSNPFNKANIKTYIIDAGIKLYVYPEFYKSPEDVYDFIKQFAEENFDWN